MFGQDETKAMITHKALLKGIHGVAGQSGDCAIFLLTTLVVAFLAQPERDLREVKFSDKAVTYLVKLGLSAPNRRGRIRGEEEVINDPGCPAD